MASCSPEPPRATSRSRPRPSRSRIRSPRSRCSRASCSWFGHGAEIPRDTDIYEARASSPVLAVLVSPRPIDLPDGLLIPAALFGIAALWRERRRLAAPLWLLATIAASCVVFFVTSRHRAPALPLFALFAAGGWRPLLVLVRRRRAVAVAIGAVVDRARHSNVGDLAVVRGRGRLLPRARGTARSVTPMEPRAAFRQATAENPGDARAWFELGNRSSSREAAAAWAHAAGLDPWDTRASRRAGAGARPAAAISRRRSRRSSRHPAHARHAHYAPDHLNLAFMEARDGKVDRRSPTSPPRAPPIPSTSVRRSLAWPEPPTPTLRSARHSCRGRRRSAMSQRVQRRFTRHVDRAGARRRARSHIAQHLLGRTIDLGFRTSSTDT